MRLLKFLTTTRDRVPIGQFFFRDGDKNLGPLEIRLPVVYVSRYAIPDEKFEQLLGQIHNDTSKRDIKRHGSPQRYTFSMSHYNSVRSNMHISAHGDPESLEAVLSQGVPAMHFLYRNRLENIGYADWLRLEFDWTKDVSLDDRVEEALRLQKQAHLFLRLISDNYLLEIEEGILETDNQLRVEGVESADYHQHLLNGKAQMPEHIQDLWKLREAQGKQLSNRIAQLRKAFNKDDYSQLPPDIRGYVQQLREIRAEVLALISGDRFTGEVKVDFRDLNMQIYLPGYNIFNLRFSDSQGLEVPHIVAYDIEVTAYRGSPRNPSGINPRVCLTSICSNIGETVEGKTVIESVGIKEIAQISSIFKDIVVGYLDIGTRLIHSPRYNRTALYVKVDDSDVVRRTVAEILWLKNPLNLGGHNSDSYDASRLLNPNRDEAVIADLPQVLRGNNRFIKLFKSDGVFRADPDNSEWKYDSKGPWLTNFKCIPSRADTLKPCINYLSQLTADNKLETIGNALDFLVELGVGFEKSILGYGDLEDIIGRAEQGNKEAAYQAALYAYEDNIAQLRIVEYFTSIFRKVSKCLDIEQDIVFRASKSRLASLWWDRYLYKKRGTVTHAAQRNVYHDFDVEKSKRRALNLAFKRVHGIKFEPAKGIFEDVAIFFTPYYTEGTMSVIEKHEDKSLHRLYQTMISSEDLIERVILQQILDQLAIHYLVDAKRVKKSDEYDSELWHRYGISWTGRDNETSNANVIIDEFRKKMDGIAQLFDKTQPINHTGNLLFVDATDENLVQRLKDYNFTYIGTGNIISVEKGRVIYCLRKDRKMHTASVGFEIESPKKRVSSDNVLQGFNPNVYDNFIYDLGDIYFREGQDTARQLLQGFIRDFESLPPQAFFMTLTAGQNLENYAASFRRTKRFRIMDKLGMRKGQRRVIIFESPDGEILEPVVVDTSNPQSWQELKPYVPCYQALIFDKKRNLYQLCKALGIQDVLGNV